MPTREQVFAVCDGLRARKARVSLATVRTALPRGGSNRDVGPHLASWKAERGYKARLETQELPEAVQALVLGFVNAAWEAAKADAAKGLARERERAEVRDRARDEVLCEALARLDVLEAANARLVAEAEAQHAEADRLRRRLDHLRAEEFWDRVMREVHAVLPPAGGLSAEEILPLLRASVHRGARLHREPLDAATLRKKMRVRAHWNRYFAEGEGGLFGRLGPGASGVAR